jgi:hypothetical protein
MGAPSPDGVDGRIELVAVPGCARAVRRLVGVYGAGSYVYLWAWEPSVVGTYASPLSRRSSPNQLRSGCAKHLRYATPVILGLPVFLTQEARTVRCEAVRSGAVLGLPESLVSREI